MISFTSKLPSVADSIFSSMSQLAKDNGAVDLSQGFPDFPIDQELIHKVNLQMNMGRNQYATSNGIPDLQDRISHLFSSAYERQIDGFNEVTITSGATEAICAAVCALVNEGDEVIIFDPSYDSYDPLVTMNKGIPVRIRLKAPVFQIDWQEVEDKISPKTKVIMINSPHNPTGTILSQEDLLHLQKLVLEHDLYVISDEVYHHITFDGSRHESVLRYPDLFERSVAAFSFGKMYHVTGWKVGFSVAPKWLTDEIRKIHQFMTFSVHTPSQYAICEALSEGLSFSALSEFFQRKRDLFLSKLDTDQFDCRPAQGTYFQLLTYQTEESDIDLTQRLTKDFKVAGIPISVFYEGEYDPHTIRFCFAKSDDTISSGVEILNKVQL